MLLELRAPPTTTRPDVAPTALLLPLLWHNLIAGGIAGSSGVVIGHPLDLLKVRMQTMSSRGSLAAGGTSIGGASGVGGTSVAELACGARSFGAWNVTGVPLATAAVANASIFLTYGGATQTWDRHYNIHHVEGGSAADKWSFARNATCGAVAGTMSLLILCPSEYVKTKLQIQHRTHGSGTYWGCSMPRNTYSTVMRGLVATLTRQVPNFVVYFGTNDRLKAHAIANYDSTQPTIGCTSAKRSAFAICAPV